MRNEREITDMLVRFAEAGEDVDSDTEAARDALLWVVDPHVNDERVTDYLPD